MANKWEYRRTDVYWFIAQETRLQKRVLQQGTTDIAAPLDTPRRMSPAYQQQWMRGRRRVREEQYTENVHEIRHVVDQSVTPQVYNQPVAGAFSAGQLVGSLDHLTNKNLAGGLTPAGALDVAIISPLEGTITPTGTDTTLLSRTFTPAGLTPAGNLVSELVLAPALVLVAVRNRAITHSRPFRWATYSQRAVVSVRDVIETPQSVDGAMTPTATVGRLVSKNVSGGFVP